MSEGISCWSVVTNCGSISPVQTATHIGEHSIGLSAIGSQYGLESVSLYKINTEMKSDTSHVFIYGLIVGLMAFDNLLTTNPTPSK